MHLVVTVPESDVGNVLTDLTGTRQAMVLGVDMLPDSSQQVIAEVEFTSNISISIFFLRSYVGCSP
eukprot:m.206629 g.206629  ORF g.206629 m.206629 type:complete len:66 (-) comp15795_c0_seq29:61-258(-)